MITEIQKQCAQAMHDALDSLNKAARLAAAEGLNIEFTIQPEMQVQTFAQTGGYTLQPEQVQVRITRVETL